VPFGDEARALAMEWRKLTRAATFVAVLTSPATMIFLTVRHGWGLLPALAVTFLTVVAFRGLVDVLAHRFIPRASLYGAERPLLEEDVVARRRTWYWRTKWRRWTYIASSFALLMVVANVIHNLSSDEAQSFGDTFSLIGNALPLLFIQFLPYLFLFPLLFFFNFLILFGPLVFFGVKQMKGYEPGDADWGRAPGRRARPDRAQGGRHARHLAVAVRRGVPRGGRQARARPAVHRRAGHRQDDALQGDRHELQLADHDDAGLGLRVDLHGHGRRHRADPHRAGAAPGAQVGRAVHHLHRRKSTPSACDARR